MLLDSGEADESERKRKKLIKCYWLALPDARFYYMRTVLHDWDEDNSVKILKNTAAAMGPDSQLLIDEMALPNKGVHWWPACLDLHMYTMLNALERTVEQWQDLLTKADLRLVDIRTYAPVMKNSIIVAERLEK
jgi:hypothetical protein